MITTEHSTHEETFPPFKGFLIRSLLINHFLIFIDLRGISSYVRGFVYQNRIAYIIHGKLAKIETRYVQTKGMNLKGKDQGTEMEKRQGKRKGVNDGSDRR